MPGLLKSILLLEGITHLEDLPLDEFIRTVETLKNKIVTEKLDGANLWFGLDDTGVYTSREGKSPKKGRFYDVSGYNKTAAYNGFRAAHLAIEAIEPSIRKHLQPGDSVEVEVLFGRQPNTVTYGIEGKNFIVILRGVSDTPDERVKALAKAVNNKIVTVKSDIISSPDGDKLTTKAVELKWEFTNVAPMDTAKVDTKEALVRLAELKKFLSKKNGALADLTNKQVAELSLTSIPKADREQAKKERERVNAYIMDEFKNPIKELLLNNFVRKVKPFLQANDLDSSEDIGVEGVVVRDPVSGSQTKIVDKDVFTAINIFNWSVLNNISGLVKTSDQDAPIEMRGGVFGQAKIRIANLLGAKELAVSSTAKKFIAKYAKSSPQETAGALASALDVKSAAALKTKISAILKGAVSEVDKILGEFKQDSGKFKLQLKTGKEIGISPEVMKRTLTAFAETKNEINEINRAVLKSENPAQLIMALYGKTINSLFSEGDTPVKESFNLLRSLQEEGDGGGGGGDGSAGAVGDSGGASHPSNGTEAQLTNPAGHPVLTRTSAIAPFPFKLFKNKAIIQRRKRNFEKSNKFSIPKKLESIFGPSSTKFTLIKSVNEDWAHVKDMKFATDVDDTVGSQNDVEFNRLRNNIGLGKDVSTMDVNRYLDKAHELNDEVDTVTFGLETDTNHIVKVYVNAEQADGFEEALAQLLGQEDDVEKVINDMADKFDIVDVEWPEEMAQSGDEELSDEDDIDFDTASDEEPTDEDDIDFDTASDEEPSDEESAEDDIDFDTASDEESSDEEPSDEEPSDEEPAEDEPSDEEPSDEEPSDEEPAEEEPSDEDMPPLAKKKPKKKEESIMTTFGERFKQRVLQEAKAEKKSAPDSEVIEFLDNFPNKNRKIVLALMISLGAPLQILRLHRAEILDSSEQAVEELKINAALRTWSKKLMISLADEAGIEAAKEASTKIFNLKEDAMLERMMKNYQWLIYELLRKLGLPSSVEKAGRQKLISNIRELALVVQKNSALKRNLMMVAELFGIDYKQRFKNEESAKNESVSSSEEVILENTDEAVAAVNDLFSALGFSVDINRSIINQQKMPQVKTVMMKVATTPRAIKFMNMATSLIREKTNSTDIGGVTEEKEDDADWSVADMRKRGLVFRGKGITLKFDREEAEKLAIAFDMNKKVAVKTESGDMFTFKPSTRGYYVKGHDDEKFPYGFTMKKEIISNVIEIFNEV